MLDLLATNWAKGYFESTISTLGLVGYHPNAFDISIIFSQS